MVQILMAFTPSFQSTLSSRRATQARDQAEDAREISIHALLTESDPGHPDQAGDQPPISIHALLTESDAGGSEGDSD